MMRMLEESYRNGKRVDRGSPEAEWDVVCVSWGWDAVQRPRANKHPRRIRKNFPKFDQAEAYAIEQSKKQEGE